MDSEQGQIIGAAKLIIYDEISMTKKNDFKVIDRICQVSFLNK